MPRDFLPSKDADLLAWSSNFSTRITATPTAFGLVAAQATAYAALHSSFASALTVATDPGTRTRGTVAAKNDARAPLRAEARELSRIIQAFPATTTQQRIDLGLNPRDNPASPIPAPQTSPVLEILSVQGRLFKLRLREVNSERRGRPIGVEGATIMSYVGAQPPADKTLWRFEGSITRTNKFDLEFPASVAAGAQVWLCAFWYSPRAESGPACAPVGAYVAGGVVQGEAA